METTNQIYKILVAEDDVFLAKIYAMKLEKYNFQVIVVSDGQQVLDYLHTDIPDIILLDVMMPVKDGFTTLEEIKKDSKWAKIPIIIASNLGQKEDITKGQQLGANDYIVKSDTSLDSVVQKILALLPKPVIDN